MKRGPREPRYTEREWRLIDEFRRYWGPFCNCDPIPIDSDDFLDRLKKAGYVRWRAVRISDTEETPFASELGIEMGGYLWELTKKGRAKLESPHD